MADHRYLVRLQGLTGLPEDVYENTLYYETSALDTIEGRCDDIAAAYDAMPLLAGWNGMQIRVYELAGGQPIEQHDYPSAASTGETGPGEVAICLSYATVDDPEASTGRRRGRIYLGPLGAAQVGQHLVSDTQIDAVLDFGELLAGTGFASATTWKMYSPTDNVTAKIESIWCDDAWDTQRRRGLAPTKRIVRDVQ
jgi:hypothetical protein